MLLDSKLQTNADAALTTLADNLRTRQAGVLGRAGRYRQCIVNRSWDTWDAYKPDPAALQNVRVDEYFAPDGPGYSITGEVTDADGVVWRRTVHCAGPESWRESGWAAVAAEALR